MKKITIMGTGYVGLVTGTCLAELGHEVTAVDIDELKINNLNKGIIPIYEQGLEELVKENKKQKRLFFTTDIDSAIKQAEGWNPSGRRLRALRRRRGRQRLLHRRTCGRRR